MLHLTKNVQTYGILSLEVQREKYLNVKHIESTHCSYKVINFVIKQYSLTHLTILKTLRNRRVTFPQNVLVLSSVIAKTIAQLIIHLCNLSFSGGGFRYIQHVSLRILIYISLTLVASTNSLKVSSLHWTIEREICSKLHWINLYSIATCHF